MFRALKRLLLPSQPVVKKFPFGIASGIRMEINFQHQTLVYLGLYEHQLNTHIRAMIPPGSKCFDVGGCNGYDALIFAKLSRQPVVSFECDAQAVPTMQRNFACNSYEIQIIQAYVSDVVGTGTTTLDDAAGRCFIPDFIKLDIEGAEAKALRGARKILTERKPHLIIETHGKDVEGECLEILRAHGYQPQIIDQPTWPRELRPLAHNRWLACYGKPAGTGPIGPLDKAEEAT